MSSSVLIKHEYSSVTKQEFLEYNKTILGYVSQNIDLGDGRRFVNHTVSWKKVAKEYDGDYEVVGFWRVHKPSASTLAGFAVESLDYGFDYQVLRIEDVIKLAALFKGKWVTGNAGVFLPEWTSTTKSRGVGKMMEFLEHWDPDLSKNFSIQQ